MGFGSYRINRKMYNEYWYHLPDSCETLITGSSLVTCGLNPKVIRNSVNIGLAAEPLAVTFLKLRDILNRPHGLKRVVISYSLLEMGSQFSSFYGSKSGSIEMFERLSGQSDYPSLSDLEYFRVDKFSYFEVYMRNRIFPSYQMLSGFINQNYSANKFLHIGEFTDEAVFNQNEVAVKQFDYEQIGSRRFNFKRDHEKIKIDLKYLDKICALCLDSGVKLTIVGMPMHQELYKVVPDEYLSCICHCKVFLKKYPNVAFVDYSAFPLEHDCFRDYAHLNMKGSLILSNCLNEFLYSGE